MTPREGVAELQLVWQVAAGLSYGLAAVLASSAVALFSELWHYSLFYSLGILLTAAALAFAVIGRALHRQNRAAISSTVVAAAATAWLALGFLGGFVRIVVLIVIGLLMSVIGANVYLSARQLVLPSDRPRSVFLLALSILMLLAAIAATSTGWCHQDFGGIEHCHVKFTTQHVH